MGQESKANLLPEVIEKTPEEIDKIIAAIKRMVNSVALIFCLSNTDFGQNSSLPFEKRFRHNQNPLHCFYFLTRHFSSMHGNTKNALIALHTKL